MKKIHKTNILMAVAIVTVGILLALQFTFILAIANELGRQDRERVWDTRLIYACYNNEIHPCDDSGVAEWNKSNPDKAITESYLRTK